MAPPAEEFESVLQYTHSYQRGFPKHNDLEINTIGGEGGEEVIPEGLG